MLWRTLEPFLQTPSVKDGTCIHRPCCVPLPFQQSLLYSSLLYLLFLSSGYFNGTRFFQDDLTDQRNAAGGICMNMSVVCLTSFCFSLLFPEPVALIIIIIIAFTHLTLNLNFQFFSMCTVHHLCSIARTIQCRSRAIHNHAMIFIFPHPLTFFINHIPFN